MSTGRGFRAVFSYRLEPLAVPGETEHGRESVALAFDGGEHTGKFLFDDDQALVGDRGLFQHSVKSWQCSSVGDLDAFIKAVVQPMDQAFPGRQAVADTILNPALMS